MAASSSSPSSVPRPDLLVRIEQGRDTITGVYAICEEEAVLSSSEDKTVKVWVKRDNGQYWPSIVHTFESVCSCLYYEPQEDRNGHVVFVGLSNGQIQEFRLSKDLNRFERKRSYQCHSSRVTSVKFISKHNWLLSCGRDKRFIWSCTETGRALGTHESTAWCLAVEYDELSLYGFVAEYSGAINVFKLERDFTHVTTLKGHNSSIWAMTYDPERRLLFSGGFDQVIVVWDIGNQQGSAYELTGHTGKIRSLAYSSHTRKLLSSSEDGKLGVWDMDVDREETVEWAHSNICEKCSVPFFWNFRVMWDNKMIGVRQHHCRKCGRAVCSSCSDQQSTYPTMGYEKPVRMCQDCHSSLTTDDRNPLAVFLSIKSPFTKIDFVQTKGLMITSSDDKQIKVWDVTSMMMNH